MYEYPDEFSCFDMNVFRWPTEYILADVVRVGGNTG